MEIQNSIVFIAVFSLLILAEIGWSILKKKDNYNLKESLSNFSIILIGKFIQPLSLAWSLVVFELFAGFKLFDIPSNTYTFIIAFVAVEFFYYWYHRFSHEVPFLWAIHHTHHSSIWFNLTAAGRLNWIGKFISPLFFIPLILLGFSAEFISLGLGIGLMYQFFLHTEAVGKLGIFEGKLLNTPSAHRVHHGANEEYLDKNYGGMLIIWDRLFGTYVTETEKTKYGVTTGFIGFNPIIINFKPLFDFFRKSGVSPS